MGCGCWLVITYQERGLLNHTPTWHEGPPSVRWLRSYIWSLPHGGWAGGWFWFATTGYDPKVDEQCVFIHCWWHDTNESTFENSLICPALCPFWQKVKKPQNPIFDLYVKKKDSKYVIRFWLLFQILLKLVSGCEKNLIWRYCKPFGQITVYISWHCTMCCLYNNIFASV